MDATNTLITCEDLYEKFPELPRFDPRNHANGISYVALWRHAETTGLEIYGKITTKEELESFSISDHPHLAAVTVVDVANRAKTVPCVGSHCRVVDAPMVHTILLAMGLKLGALLYDIYGSAPSLAESGLVLLNAALEEIFLKDAGENYENVRAVIVQQGRPGRAGPVIRVRDGDEALVKEYERKIRKKWLDGHNQKTSISVMNENGGVDNLEVSVIPATSGWNIGLKILGSMFITAGTSLFVPMLKSGAIILWWEVLLVCLFIALGVVLLVGFGKLAGRDGI